MQVTIQHLLRFLPMDKEVREKALASYDTMTVDQKLELQQVCWETYFTFYRLTVEHEFEKALEEVKKGKRKWAQDMRQQVEEYVFSKFTRDIREGQEAAALDDIRKNLQTMMEERILRKKSGNSH